MTDAGVVASCCSGSCNVLHMSSRKSVSSPCMHALEFMETWERMLMDFMEKCTLHDDSEGHGMAPCRSTACTHELSQHVYNNTNAVHCTCLLVIYSSPAQGLSRGGRASLAPRMIAGAESPAQGLPAVSRGQSIELFCVCVYVCVCMCVYICMYMYVCMHACMYVCLCVGVYVCIRTYVRPRTCNGTFNGTRITKIEANKTSDTSRCFRRGFIH